MSKFSIDLIECWISKLNFKIESGGLYIGLEAFEEDFTKAFKIFLSADEKDILRFFGFDVEIDYCKLKPYNMYPFLSNTSKLTPGCITYYGFKGPHARNSEHTKFNDYLRSQFIDKNEKLTDEVIQKWQSDAIKYFAKEKEYQLYLEKYKVINTVRTLKVQLKPRESVIWRRFIVFNGINTIKDWDFVKFQLEWNAFKKENWSGLDIYSGIYY